MVQLAPNMMHVIVRILRVDAERRWDRVEMTQQWIFEQGIAVGGKIADLVLAATSSIPIHVSPDLFGLCS